MADEKLDWNDEGFFGDWPLTQAATRQEWRCAVCAEPLAAGSFSALWFGPEGLTDAANATLCAAHVDCCEAASRLRTASLAREQAVATYDRSALRAGQNRVRLAAGVPTLEIGE